MFMPMKMGSCCPLIHLRCKQIIEFAISLIAVSQLMKKRQWFIELTPKPRGFHLVTHEIVEQIDLQDIESGVLHLFIQHSSASLTLNENADPTVRSDMELFANRLVPDHGNQFDHTLEGPDDMPAHVKTSVFGSSLSLPISNSRLALGTWQGVWLGEHRDYGGARKLVATLL